MDGIKEVCDILISAIATDEEGNVSNVPYLFIETAKTSETTINSETVIAQGGKRSIPLIAWSGAKKTTLKFTDALINLKSIELLLNGSTNKKTSIKTLRKKKTFGKTNILNLLGESKTIEGKYFEEYYDIFSDTLKQREILLSADKFTIEEKPSIYDKSYVFKKMKERTYDSKYGDLHIGKFFTHELNGNTITFYCNTSEKEVENSVKIDAIYYMEELSDLIFSKYDIENNIYVVQKIYSQSTDFYNFFNPKIKNFSSYNKLVYEILTKYPSIEVSNIHCVLDKNTLLPLEDEDILYEGQNYLLFGFFEENAQEIEEIDSNLFYSVKYIGIRRDRDTGEDKFYEIEYPKVFFENNLSLNPSSDGEPIVLDFSAIVLSEPLKKEIKISMLGG